MTDERQLKALPRAVSRFTCSLPQEITQKLDAHARRSGNSRNALLRMAVREFLDRQSSSVGMAQ